MIQVEDLIDDIEAFVNAAAFLKCYSVQKIYVLATHGVLSSDVELLEESAIDEVNEYFPVLSHPYIL